MILEAISWATALKLAHGLQELLVRQAPLQVAARTQTDLGQLVATRLEELGQQGIGDASEIAEIESKRDALGINVEKERKLYDMEDRRVLSVE